jgi:hypothetical protein
MFRHSCSAAALAGDGGNTAPVRECNITAATTTGRSGVVNGLRGAVVEGGAIGSDEQRTKWKATAACLNHPLRSLLTIFALTLPQRNVGVHCFCSDFFIVRPQNSTLRQGKINATKLKFVHESFALGLVQLYHAAVCSKHAHTLSTKSRISRKVQNEWNRLLRGRPDPG